MSAQMSRVARPGLTSAAVSLAHSADSSPRRCKACGDPVCRTGSCSPRPRNQRIRRRIDPVPGKCTSRRFRTDSYRLSEIPTRVDLRTRCGHCGVVDCRGCEFSVGCAAWQSFYRDCRSKTPHYQMGSGQCHHSRQTRAEFERCERHHRLMIEFSLCFPILGSAQSVSNECSMVLYKRIRN